MPPTPESPDLPDPVPARSLDVLALFEAELAGVRFPDLDREVLTELATSVRSRAAEVARARAFLDDAKAALAESQALLERGTERAIAYARIYGDGNEALGARLDELMKAGSKSRKDASTPAAAKQEAAKKVRKPKRSGPELPFEEPAEENSELAEAS